MVYCIRSEKAIILRYFRAFDRWYQCVPIHWLHIRFLSSRSLIYTPLFVYDSVGSSTKAHEQHISKNNPHCLHVHSIGLQKKDLGQVCVCRMTGEAGRNTSVWQHRHVASLPQNMPQATVFPRNSAPALISFQLHAPRRLFNPWIVHMQFSIHVMIVKVLFNTL